MSSSSEVPHAHGCRRSTPPYEILSALGSGSMGEVYRNKMMAVNVSTGVEFTRSSPRPLFEQPYVFQNISVANYAIGTDGQRFLMVKDEAGSGRLNIVLNWFEELKALVPTK